MKKLLILAVSLLVVCFSTLSFALSSSIGVKNDPYGIVGAANPYKDWIVVVEPTYADTNRPVWEDARVVPVTKAGMAFPLLNHSGIKFKVIGCGRPPNVYEKVDYTSDQVFTRDQVFHIPPNLCPNLSSGK